MKKQRLNIILFVFLVVILFVFNFNFTSSRYMGQIKSEVKDVIAIPIIDLTNPTFEYELTNILPGFVDESDFYVSNYDEKNDNEVLMKYYLTIQTEGIPVKITLTDENKKEISLDQEKKTEEQELTFGEKTRTKYHIKIEWDKKDNDSSYANKKLKLIIDLKSTQVVAGS